jgi:hypothetical protein
MSKPEYTCNHCKKPCPEPRSRSGGPILCSECRAAAAPPKTHLVHYARPRGPYGKPIPLPGMPERPAPAPKPIAPGPWPQAPDLTKTELAHIDEATASLYKRYQALTGRHRRDEDVVAEIRQAVITEVLAPRAQVVESAPDGKWLKQTVVEAAEAYDAKAVVDAMAAAVRVAKKGKRLRHAARKLMLKAEADGQPYPRCDVAEKLGVSIEDLDRILNASEPPRQLDHKVSPGPDGDKRLLRDVLPDDDLVDPLERVIRLQQQERTTELLDLLTPAERAGMLGIDRKVTRQAAHAAMVRGLEKLVAETRRRGWYEEPEIAKPSRWTDPAKATAYAHKVQRRGAVHLVERSHDPAGTTATRMLGDRGLRLPDHISPKESHS